ncbi:MAG: 3-dehydroquinate synthase [Flavobacteriales bacterium]|nr:3-dehydroquinate synthase [Flavobacteriales bacterium]
MSINNIINIKTKTSEVFVGDEVFNVLNEYLRPYRNSKIFILVDENTLKHCVTELITQNKVLHNAEILEIDSGEENKTLDVCYQLWKTLAEYRADRNSLLINLGGGVITDMGGFIASTYKRGIDFINIPTTLLSQIDASVGGKTGVDFEGLKNVIGVFNEAKGVFIYPDFLKTLDKRQMLSGYAEALKHALIKDSKYWKALEKGMLSDSKNWLKLITTSINIKNEIVLNDPFESGERKLLNFGHTIGHAIESYSLLNDAIPLCHGEAVAIGMICESYISRQQQGLSNDELIKICSTINGFYKPYELKNSDFHQLIELMKNDKKNENNGIIFTLLSKIGEADFNQEVEVEVILDALNYYNSLNND